MRKREGERERPNAKSKAENAHREDYYQPNKCVWVYILRLVSDQVNVQQNHLLCVPFFFSLAPNWSLYSATEFSLALVFAVPLIPSSLDIERKASPEKSLFHLLLIFIVFLRHTTSSHLCISPKKTHTHTHTHARLSGHRMCCLKCFAMAFLDCVFLLISELEKRYGTKNERNNSYHCHLEHKLNWTGRM